jgi:RNA polymerase sigma-70 factor, ECF subfamily
MIDTTALDSPCSTQWIPSVLGGDADAREIATVQHQHSDRNLVARAQSGESAAFNSLVQKYRHRILKLTMRFTRNRADAEEIVQITFIKAFLGVRQFRGDSAFYSWLHRIAINAAKTVRKQRARDPCRSLDLSAYEESNFESVAPKELDTPEEIALTEEIGVVVNSAIERLPEEQRTAIVLRELEGMSYAAVAAEMACPIGTVRSRVFRAREAIDVELRHVFDEGLSRSRRPALRRA